MKARKELTAEKARQYRAARGRKAKGAVLDAFITDTGYNRKYAIGLLNAEGKVKIRYSGGKPLKVEIRHNAKKKRKRKRHYDEAVKEALEKIWEKFDFQCGKLLAPFIHENADVIRLDEEHKMDDAVAAKLKKISPATIDRLLKKAKQAAKTKGTSGTVSVRRLNLVIPTETWRECAEKPPGYNQIDLVQHDGGCPSGEFCYTMTMTGAATGWTTHRTHKNKAHRWVKDSLDKAKQNNPLGLKGIHSDCGSEFINSAVKNWADENSVEFTKSRVGHSNDNCFVEQKNFATVRKIIGYFRYEGEDARDALQAVWDSYDLLLNLYYPCMRLISQQRIGAKKIRRYDKARTPMRRVMEHKDTTEEVKLKLLKLKSENPLCELKRKMAEALENLKQFRHTVPKIVRG
jgi:hypothetical protein